MKWFAKKNKQYKYISNPKFNNNPDTGEEFLLNINEENNRNNILDTTEKTIIKWKEKEKKTLIFI